MEIAVWSARQPMKILLIIVVLAVLAALAFADYKWRRWMADRRRERQ